MKLFRCHWSDNRNELGQPVYSGKVIYDLPFVYLKANNYGEAQAIVANFNKEVEPEMVGANTAHIPLALMNKHHIYPR